MITNKLFVRTICTVLVGITILSAGCGNVGELSDAASIEESTKQKNTDAVLYAPLVAPTVKDGIIELGDGFIPVCFEWNAVEGADGYQIWEESKSRSEETYHEPECDSASYTSETYYLANTQENNIDFRIKVRAYRGEGDNWEYSEWSEYAYGSSYENDNSYVKDDNIEYKYESGDKKIPKIPQINSGQTYVKNSIYLPSACKISCSELGIYSYALYNTGTRKTTYFDGIEYDVSEAGYYIVYGFKDNEMLNVTDELSIEESIPAVIE